MTILADWEIKRRCLSSEPMIDPFVDHQVNSKKLLIGTNESKIISYGLSGHGYDLRSANEFWVFNNTYADTVIDPHLFEEKSVTKIQAEEVIIPPHGFILTRSVEYISMPTDTLGLVIGKSSLARCGIQTLATPLEGGWKGQVTLEFFNSNPLPVKLRAGEGCCQVLFLQGESATKDYATRAGKYQGTLGIVPSKA